MSVEYILYFAVDYITSKMVPQIKQAKQNRTLYQKSQNLEKITLKILSELQSS